MIHSTHQLRIKLLNVEGRVITFRQMSLLFGNRFLTVVSQRISICVFPFVSFHLLGPFVAPPQHVAAAAEEESKWWSLEKR